MTDSMSATSFATSRRSADPAEGPCCPVSDFFTTAPLQGGSPGSESRLSLRLFVARFTSAITKPFLAGVEERRVEALGSRFRDAPESHESTLGAGPSGE